MKNNYNTEKRSKRREKEMEEDIGMGDKCLGAESKDCKKGKSFDKYKPGISLHYLLCGMFLF